MRRLALYFSLPLSLLAPLPAPEEAAPADIQRFRKTAAANSARLALAILEVLNGTVPEAAPGPGQRNGLR